MEQIKQTWDEKKRAVIKYVMDNKENLDTLLCSIGFSVGFAIDKFILHPIKKLRINGTKFSDLTNGELYNKFTKDYFNNASKNNLEHLFQEVYNRQTKKADCTPKYICNVGKNRKGTEHAIGYLEVASNKLHLNYDIIKKVAKEGLTDGDMFTKETLGPVFLNVIFHETQHNIQNEKMADFILANKQAKHDKAMSAINLVTLYMMAFSNMSMNTELIDYVKQAYNFDLNEHDANIAALKGTKEAVDKKEITDKAFLKAAKTFVGYTIKVPTQDLDLVNVNNLTRIRMQDMRKNIVDMSKIFNKVTKDCPLKIRIMETIKQYVALDEKGNCELYERLRDDFALCQEILKDIKMSQKNPMKNNNNILNIVDMEKENTLDMESLEVKM